MILIQVSLYSSERLLNLEAVMMILQGLLKALCSWKYCPVESTVLFENVVLLKGLSCWKRCPLKSKVLLKPLSVCSIVDLSEIVTSIQAEFLHISPRWILEDWRIRGDDDIGMLKGYKWLCFANAKDSYIRHFLPNKRVIGVKLWIWFRTCRSNNALLIFQDQFILEPWRERVAGRMMITSYRWTLP